MAIAMGDSYGQIASGQNQQSFLCVPLRLADHL